MPVRASIIPQICLSMETASQIKKEKKEKPKCLRDSAQVSSLAGSTGLLGSACFPSQRPLSDPWRSVVPPVQYCREDPDLRQHPSIHCPDPLIVLISLGDKSGAEKGLVTVCTPVFRTLPEQLCVLSVSIFLVTDVLPLIPQLGFTLHVQCSLHMLTFGFRSTQGCMFASLIQKARA